MAKPLDGVSKKSKDLYKVLSQNAITAIDGRITNATKQERKDIEALLHFPYNKRGGTTSDSRADIRAAVTSYLATGGTLAGAKELRQMLTAMPPAELKKLSGKMCADNANHANLLVDTINPLSPTRREQFATLTKVVEGFPGDPSKANQVMVGDAFVTIGRDSSGAVKVLNADAGLVNVQIPDNNRNFDANKVQEVRSSFDEVVQMSYGRSTVPLDFVRHAREEHAKNGTSMSDALKSYQPKGGQLMATGKNGDCLSGAELLIAKLKAKGIDAYAAGTWNNDLTQQRVGTTKVSPGDSNIQTGCITHLDVIVPYVDANNQERVLVITPGMGTDGKYFKDMPLSDLNGPSMANSRVRISPDGTGVDSVGIQKSALGYLTNIQITNGPPGTDGNKQICGIDLTAGTLYINTAAGNAYNGARPDGTGAIMMKFKDVADDPHGKVKLKTPGGKEVEVTKAEALALFAKGIQEQFKLQPEFVDNVMHLASNQNQYNQSVLWSSVQSMHGIDQAPKVTTTNPRLDQLPKPKVDAPTVDTPQVGTKPVSQTDDVGGSPRKKTVGESMKESGEKNKTPKKSQEQSVSVDQDKSVSVSQGKSDPSNMSVKDKIKLYGGGVSKGGVKL